MQVAALDARTEGWVAGLQLAGLALQLAGLALQGTASKQGQRDADTFIKGKTCSASWESASSSGGHSFFPFR